MDFFLDENLPLSLVDALGEQGFEVSHVRLAGMTGAEDEEIAEHAKDREAVLITKDLEFGSSILYPEGSHHGLLIVRLPHDFGADKLVENTENFIAKNNLSELEGRITVLELDRKRVRPLPGEE